MYYLRLILAPGAKDSGTSSTHYFFNGSFCFCCRFFLRFHLNQSLIFHPCNCTSVLVGSAGNQGGFTEIRQARLPGIPVLALFFGKGGHPIISYHCLDATKLDKKNYAAVFEILTKHQGATKNYETLITIAPSDKIHCTQKQIPFGVALCSPKIYTWQKAGGGFTISKTLSRRCFKPSKRDTRVLLMVFGGGRIRASKFFLSAAGF